MKTDVEKAEEAVELLSHIMNHYGRGESVTAFLNAMEMQHRTLQQSITGLMMLWFKHLSELPDYGYDLRNEHAVKVAKKIRVLLEAEYGSAWCHMPHF